MREFVIVESMVSVNAPSGNHALSQSIADRVKTNMNQGFRDIASNIAHSAYKTPDYAQTEVNNIIQKEIEEIKTNYFLLLNKAILSELNIDVANLNPKLNHIKHYFIGNKDFHQVINAHPHILIKYNEVHELICSIHATPYKVNGQYTGKYEYVTEDEYYNCKKTLGKFLKFQNACSGVFNNLAKYFENNVGTNLFTSNSLESITGETQIRPTDKLIELAKYTASWFGEENVQPKQIPSNEAIPAAFVNKKVLLEKEVQANFIEGEFEEINEELGIFNTTPITHKNDSPVTSQEIKNLVSAMKVPADLQDLNLDNFLQNVADKSSHSQSSNQAISELKAELEEMRNMFSKYQSANEDEKVKLKQEIEWLKTVIEKHSDVLDNVQTSFEQDTQELQDYYDGFVSTFTGAFVSALAVLDGKLKIDGDNNIKLKLGLPLLKLIPALGEYMATGIQSTADKKIELKVKDYSENIRQFGVSVTKFEKFAKYIANTIINKPEMTQHIQSYSPEKLPTETLLAKLKSFGTKKKEDVEKLLYKATSEKSSDQEILGRIDAASFIENHIANGKFLELSSSGNDALNELVSMFIEKYFEEGVEDDLQEQDAPNIQTGNVGTQANEINLEDEEEHIDSRQKHVASNNLQDVYDSCESSELDEEDPEFQQKLFAKYMKHKSQNKEKKVVIQEMHQEKEVFAAELEEIMLENEYDKQKLVEKHEIDTQKLAEQKNQLAQELEEKDGVIESQGNTIIDFRSKNQELTEANHRKDGMIQEQDVTIKELSSTLEQEKAASKNHLNVIEDLNGQKQMLTGYNKMLQKENEKQEVEIKDLKVSLESEQKKNLALFNDSSSKGTVILHEIDDFSDSNKNPMQVLNSVLTQGPNLHQQEEGIPSLGENTLHHAEVEQ
jgi:hypothetical protein